jgi:hypothetical protein
MNSLARMGVLLLSVFPTVFMPMAIKTYASAMRQELRQIHLLDQRLMMCRMGHVHQRSNPTSSVKKFLRWPGRFDRGPG